MTSKERVYRTIRGLSVDRTPVYGWLFMNLKDQIAQAFGSVEKFEDNYGFDMAHLFGGPSPFFYEKYEEIRRQEGEVTPEDALDIPLTDPDDMALYEDIKKPLRTIKPGIGSAMCRHPAFLRTLIAFSASKTISATPFCIGRSSENSTDGRLSGLKNLPQTASNWVWI